MRTVSAMTLRRHFGGLLDDVRDKAEPVLIERDGTPMAMLAPLPESARRGDDRARRKDALKRLCNLAKPTKRGRHPQAWLDRERETWTGRRP